MFPCTQRCAPHQHVRLNLLQRWEAHNAGDRDLVNQVTRRSFYNWKEELCNDYTPSAIQAGLLVDIGGGQGRLGKALAACYSELQIVVQDLPPIVEKAIRMATDEDPQQQLSHQNRVSFQAHDFFQQQPVHGAAAYFFRWVLHNWSDEVCIDILRNLVPALLPRARILVNEVCVPNSAGPNSTDEKPPLWRLRQLRQMDLSMLEFQWPRA